MKMGLFSLIFSFGIVFYACEAGLTEIKPDPADVEAMVETVTDDTWMPSNIFDVKAISDPHRIKAVEDDIRTDANEDITTTTAAAAEALNNLFSTEASWDGDSSPIFRAIRDFIFQASDDILKTETEEDQTEDPSEEIVKIIEKGLIEATTMFLNPSQEQTSTTSAIAEEPQPDISIIKIENVSPDSLLDRMGLSAVDMPHSHQALNNVTTTLSIINATTECSDCYSSLNTCVQMCFTEHNCNDVQRQARVCPPPPARLCNIFAQWGPVDECKDHGDCTSPLLCCSDGCINKCSPGVWRN